MYPTIRPHTPLNIFADDQSIRALRKFHGGLFVGRFLYWDPGFIKLRFSVLKPAAIVLSALSVVSMTAARGEEQARLPSGHYIYLGTDPETNAPKAFTVSSGGTVTWQAESKSTSDAQPITTHPDMIFKNDSLNERPPIPSGTTLTGPAVVGTQGTKPGPSAQIPKIDPRGPQPAPPSQPRNENIEKVEWPVIKFAPKQIPGSTDGFAQLTTTLDVGNSPYHGTVKYKLILLRSEPVYLTLQLLDDKGFMLHEFRVSPDSFQPISGTALVAARGTFSLKVADYERAKDFSLIGRVKPTRYSSPSPQYPYRPDY